MLIVTPEKPCIEYLTGESCIFHDSVIGCKGPVNTPYNARRFDGFENSSKKFPCKYCVYTSEVIKEIDNGT